MVCPFDCLFVSRQSVFADQPASSVQEKEEGGNGIMAQNDQQHTTNAEYTTNRSK